jgi:hypothetical protein
MKMPGLLRRFGHFLFNDRCIQHDPENGAFAHFRAFDEEFSGVVIFNDPFGECQAQSPASFLGTEPGIENFVHVRLGHPFSGI